MDAVAINDTQPLLDAFLMLFRCCRYNANGMALADRASGQPGHVQIYFRSGREQRYLQVWRGDAVAGAHHVAARLQVQRTWLTVRLWHECILKMHSPK